MFSYDWTYDSILWLNCADLDLSLRGWGVQEEYVRKSMFHSHIPLSSSSFYQWLLIRCPLEYWSVCVPVTHPQRFPIQRSGWGSGIFVSHKHVRPKQVVLGPHRETRWAFPWAAVGEHREQGHLLCRCSQCQFPQTHSADLGIEAISFYLKTGIQILSDEMLLFVCRRCGAFQRWATVSEVL